MRLRLKWESKFQVNVINERLSMNDPTNEQLLTFYRIVRRVVMLSSFIAFVELAPDNNLYVYMCRHYDALSSSVIRIFPNGDYEL
jgi:hypothetical protein